MWGYPPLTALIPGYTLHIAWLFQFLIAANKTFAITIRSSMRKWRICIFLNLLRHFQKIYSCLFLKYLCKVRHHGNYTIYSPVANCSPPNSIFSEICHPISNYSPLPPTTILGDKIWWHTLSDKIPCNQPLQWVLHHPPISQLLQYILPSNRLTPDLFLSGSCKNNHRM